MVSKINGLFGKRALYVFDPVALQSILIKDHSSYEDALFMLSMNMMLFGPSVVATIGDQHRKQRKMINPVFSTQQMRQMIPIFYQVARNLQEGIERQLRNPSGSGDIDILDWMSRAALELIGQGGLGHSFDPLVEESQSVFTNAIKDTLTALPLCPEIWVTSFRRWVLDNLVPIAKIQRLKNLSDTINAEAAQVVAQRRLAIQSGEGAILQEVGEGKDIMSVLLRANMKAEESERLGEDELAAQTATFIFAATDTTSNTLAQILQLLAQHTEVQEKLRTEILQAAGDEEIPYDQLEGLPYLDAVCRETLRLYAPVSDTFRDCIRDTVLPLSEPIQGLDGTWMKEILVPEGTRIVISIRGCNINKAIWGEDADEWKPERWLSPLPETVTNARIPGVYSNLLSFLGGGRSCIGFKFSQLEMKVVLCVLLRSFRFYPSDKEIVWNYSLVRFPTVGKDSGKPSMPMKLVPIKETMTLA
ncbi:hypothetical protein NLI96_g8207 [Meripilus lineatus]|uniref:Cytochrome P450 n=1 Tax=Meripilus lineatus TaxID=2056292 RepID=A0AAD5YE67_9APHY|nr:hypothetical protein NLI96_g8207 [Physisporinus lineatus]